MSKSVAIIGAGQIGFAAAKAFAQAGWKTTIHARSAPEWNVDDAPFASYTLGEDSAPTADCIIDTIAFDAEDVARYDPQDVGRLIAISSASVYCDDNGRTLDEAAQNGFPEFAEPVSEANPTVAPGPDTYSTRKIRMEQRALEGFGERTTILRPCAIYGPWSRHPREWWFVKRLLDGRERIPLALRGSSRFQTTDVHAIGTLALHAAEQGLGGVYNVADADSPDVEAIGKTVIQALDKTVDIVPIDGAEVGRTPWSVPRSFMIDGSKAQGVAGYRSPRYADAAGPAIEWLAKCDPDDWSEQFPQLASYPWDLFDYAAEHAFFRRHTL